MTRPTNHHAFIRGTMPNLTGGELAARVLHIRDDLPVILCTGFSESLSPEAPSEIGIRHYLHKPIPLKSLARTVRIVLNDSFQSDPPRRPSGHRRPLPDGGFHPVSHAPGS